MVKTLEAFKIQTSIGLPMKGVCSFTNESGKLCLGLGPQDLPHDSVDHTAPHMLLAIYLQTISGLTTTRCVGGWISRELPLWCVANYVLLTVCTDFLVMELILSLIAHSNFIPSLQITHQAYNSHFLVFRGCRILLLNHGMGLMFYTKSRERLRRTQNCGIVINSSIISYASVRDSNPVEGKVEYYGLLMDIIELDYYGKWKIILFRCDWVDVNTACGIKKDQFGFTMVNFFWLIHTRQQLIDELNIFSSQVKQVFYSKDPIDEDWYIVLYNTPRDLFVMGNRSRDDIDERSETLPFPEEKT
ncbi:hypothetical protein J1N35_001994 [Gossypium stocksii]|uniref:DUF4216 domain-containing protein n=1 Tax=Gossypium stocksii TaxID=47602 RepID=A0A9D3WKI8_9ROSI|nr:hypothetical protein J1N35_001994 [Gossypium stocksii]